MSTPDPVKQSKDNSCWAACMESWTGCDYSLSFQTEDYFIENYSDMKEGGLNSFGKNFNKLLSDWRLTKKTVPKGSLGGSDLDPLLAGGNCVMVIEGQGGYSHARLAYAFDSGTGQLSVMEPKYGRNQDMSVYWLGAVILVYKK